MAMASVVTLVLGSIAFAIFWVLAVFPSVPFLPIGRTAGSLLGAMLMVIFRVITPEQAYSAIDLPILGLLFGTMVVSVYLERADMFKYLGKLLSWKSCGPKDLLCRICLISAVSSALFTNDTSCVVLTEFILKIAKHQNLPPHPLLIALVTSANIGSAATPIGNPQNLVIAVQSKISFGKFLLGLLPVMMVGICVNALMLLGMYWRLLSNHKDEEDPPLEVVAEEEVASHRFSPATMSHLNSLGSGEWNSRLDLANTQSPPRANINGTVSGESEIRHDSNTLRESTDNAVQTRNETTFPKSLSSAENNFVGGDGANHVYMTKRKRVLWKCGVYLVTIGMLLSLLMGLDMSWAAITASLALIILDFRDARPSLEKVSYSLLVFFCGMFITVDGFNKTGIPTALWEMMEPHAKIDRPSGTAVLAVVILVLSNVASNVPTVLLLGGRVAASAAAISTEDENKAWLVLAWVSTVAGNLSLLGSAANMIVCEQARSAPQLGYTLTFWRHVKFGLPSTLIVTAVGLLLMRKG